MTTTSTSVDALFTRSREGARKAVEGLNRGDHSDAIYIDRELAVRYHARAMAAMHPPSLLH